MFKHGNITYKSICTDQPLSEQDQAAIDSLLSGPIPL